MDKLHLQDALDNGPQMRSLVGVFEADAKKLTEYSRQLHGCYQHVLTAQKELCLATQSLSHQLKLYGSQNFPLETDDSILSSTLQQFCTYLDELSSVQQVLVSQIADGMMYPVGKFLQADLEEIQNMSDMRKLAASEHEAAVGRYMKLSKKKDNPKLQEEANIDVRDMRRKFHQTSLHYCAALNALQYKRKCAMLEPLIVYMHATRSFFSMGKEATEKKEIDSFLSNITASVGAVKTEMLEENQKAVEFMDGLAKSSEHLYYAEIPTDVLDIPPDMDLSQKCGYLFMRTRQALLNVRWDRHYFFTQAGNLMCQQRDEVAGSLILDLNEDGIKVESVDVDDRRNCFQVTCPASKKIVILQAENEKEKQEWMATINNIIRDSGYVKEIAAMELSQGANRMQSNSPVKISPKKPSAPTTPPSTPSETGFIPDAPIQFDIITPSDEVKHFPGTKDGPPVRINPFDQSKVEITNDNKTNNSSFFRTFEVRFLGSMEVRTDRGDQLVYETIRQIMAARALHNVFRTSESHLIITNEVMRLVDPSNNVIKLETKLADISYWAVHQENRRLFGYITRSRGMEVGGKIVYTCHVYECNTSGEEICQSLTTSTTLAFQELMEKKAKESPKETQEQQDLVDSINDAESTPDGFKADPVSTTIENSPTSTTPCGVEAAPPGTSPSGNTEAAESPEASVPCNESKEE